MKKPCSIAGCENKAAARGLCHKHWARWRRGKLSVEAPLKPKPVRQRCSADGCDRLSYAMGLCSKHYARQRKHGSPLVVRRRVKHGFSRKGAAMLTHGARQVSRQPGKAPVYIPDNNDPDARQRFLDTLPKRDGVTLCPPAPAWGTEEGFVSAHSNRLKMIRDVPVRRPQFEA